jgi:integrase
MRASHQPSKDLARRYLLEVEGRIARGNVGIPEPTPEAPTVAELVERFLSEYSRPRVKDLAEYRQNARCALRRTLPLLGDKPADAVKSADIAKLRDALGEKFSAASVRVTLAFLATVFSFATKAGIVTMNPCLGIEKPPQRALLEFLSKEDAGKLLAYAYEHAPARHPMLAVALHCGLRKGELFGLRWRDLDLDARRIDVMRSCRKLPKGSKPRHLRLPSVLLAILRDWRERCPKTAESLVFPVVRRGTTNMGSSKDMLDLPELLTAAGCTQLARPWHALRHTFASHFVMNGGNILTLQKILGHSDIKMTLQYAHLAPDFLGEEMERVKF